MIEADEIRSLLATHGEKAVEFVANELGKNSTHFDELIKVLNTGNETLSTAAAETISILAYEFPHITYPFFKEIAQNISIGHDEIQGHLIAALLWMSEVDDKKLIDAYLDLMYTQAKGNYSCTFSNFVDNLPDLEDARPELNQLVVKYLISLFELKVSQSSDLAHVIESLAILNDYPTDFEEFVVQKLQPLLEIPEWKENEHLKNLISKFI